MALTRKILVNKSMVPNVSRPAFLWAA
ncbi:MAG: hypothetical protein ACI89S_002678, partial [Gammaproteobacteria bacterium]